MKAQKEIMNQTRNLVGESRETTSIIAALLAGVAIGAALGILFAPDKGSEIRNDLGDRLRDLGENVKDKAQHGRESLSSLTGKAVDAIKSKVSGVAAEHQSAEG